MTAATGHTEQTIAAVEPPQVSKVVIESRRRLIVIRLIVWVLFGVIFGLLPLIAVGLRELMSARGLHLYAVLEGGELFVISAVLSAGAVGELLAAVYRGERSLTVIFSGFGCVAMLAGNTMGYMLVGGGSSPDMVVAVSAFLFPPTLLASALSIGTAAGR
jgi:hypothetical protein